MIVSAASRTFSAISFGVFCRDAPSTRAIIRSMKLSPGFWVIRTTIRSESTLVPPVTEERSPPDSRMTGADSPVIADSSTLAMPSTTSPSPGMVSPASTTTRSPWTRSGAGTGEMVTAAGSSPGCQPVSRRATVSVRARRSASAWALPRPSATASARLANTTVSHSQTVISQAKTVGSAIASTVVKTAPISTMNMTGFRHRVRGSSLRSAPGSDRQSWAGSSRPPETRPGAAGCGVRRGRSGRTVVVISGCPPRAARARGPGSR